MRARVTEGLRSPERDVRRAGGGTLELSSSCPILFSGSCSVDYEIAVPAGTAVRVDAKGGDVDAEDLVSTQPVRLQTSGGDISATDVTAPELRLSSSAGDVEATGVRAPIVDAESSGGDVSLSLRTAPDRLDANSSAGDVELVLPDETYRVDASTSAGDVDDSQVRNDPDSPADRPRALERRRHPDRVPPLSATARSRPSARSAPARARRSSAGTFTTGSPSRSASRSFGSVIIFM